MSKSSVLPGHKTDLAVAEALGYKDIGRGFLPSRYLPDAMKANKPTWRWIFDEEKLGRQSCLYVDLWVSWPPFREKGVGVTVLFSEAEDRQGAYALGICRAVLTAHRVGII